MSLVILHKKMSMVDVKHKYEPGGCKNTNMSLVALNTINTWNDCYIKITSIIRIKG